MKLMDRLKRDKEGNEYSGDWGWMYHWSLVSISEPTGVVENFKHGPMIPEYLSSATRPASVCPPHPAQ